MTASQTESASAFANETARRTTRWISNASAPSAASSADVRTIDLRPFVERQPAWLPQVVERIGLLLSGGVQISAEAMSGIWQVLTNPVFEGTPQPVVSPVEGGGLSAEFRSGGVELQVEFEGSGEAEAYVLQRGVLEWEGELAELPDGLAKWAWRLAHPGV